MAVIPRIADYHQDMAAWRHDIHQHPELAYQEHRTAARVAALLRDFGVDEVTEGVGGTGVVGVINSGDGPSIALRADMDALPIEELAEDRPHKSVHAGTMHACGHDGHTTMLLGAARYLSEVRPFRGRVVLVFQPAEEGRAGAKAMIEDGLFSRWPVEAIYGMHNMPGIDAGAFAVAPGPVMAAADRFTITVTGHGGHAAAPHLVRDPIVAASALVSALQTIASRNTKPTDTLVVSVTQFHAGDTGNVIPDSAWIAGTVRHFDSAVGTATEARMREIAAGIAATYAVDVDVQYITGYPPTVNWDAPSALVQDAATDIFGADRVQVQTPAMFSEDFSYYLQQVPGCYAYIGNGHGGPHGCSGLHNPFYDFNDDILPGGASLFVRVVEKALPR